MYDFGRWAIFWIVLTNAVANSARNENETANGVFKSSRIVFPSPAEEKRFRQRWDNLTLASKLKSASSSAAVAATGTTRNEAADSDAKKSKNIIEEIVRQTQHPAVKKQIKYKRLRYLSSADQNNGTKLGPPPAPSPTTTASTVDQSKDDTKDSKAAFKFTDSDSFRRHQSSGQPSGSSKLHHDAKVAAVDAVFSSSQRTTAVQNGVPSHRKKRRRLPTSASIVVPLAMSTYEQQPLHHHHVPRDPQSDPFLDFGKKISVTAASFGRTPFANAIEGVRSPIVRFGAASATAEEPESDKTDRLFVAGTSLQQNYFRGSVVKPTPASGISNTSLCVPNHRAGPSRSGLVGAKGSKREIDVNGTLCRPGNTTGAESQEQAGQLRVEGPVAPTAVASTSEIPSNTVVSPSSSTTTSPSAHQLTTKILSTAVITSVSIKSNERITRHKVASSTSTPKDARLGLVELPTTFHRKAETTSSSRPFELRIAGSSREYSAVPQARHANLSKQYATITRNAVPPYSRTLVSTTPTAPAQNATQATTPESTTATADPNIQYLVHSTSTAAAAAEGEPAAETTTLAWNWRNSVEGGSNRTASGQPTETEPRTSSPSAPLFVTYEGLDRDPGNLIYHVRNDSQSASSSAGSLDNSTESPSGAFTIFTKNVHHLDHSTHKNQLHASDVIAGEQNGDNEDVVDEGDDGQTGFRIVTYVLAGLGAIPLVIGIALVTKMLLSQNKKQIFEGSEYSSEYNRNTLEFNAGVTSSPIATKLPRVSHQSHWEIEKKSNPSISLPNNSQWEFPRSKLRLQTILGQGNFGQVWKAEADDINGHEGLTRLVAVKMVKEISSTREKEDLIKELIIMQHLGTHPNVVTLLGCCTEKEPYMLIMEYVMYGKLLSFLRDHRTRTHYFNFSDNGDTLTSRDLTVFAYCVARGMEYLQNKQVIHRDLAARNILIDHNKLCKIADFGMSRYVEESGQVYEHRQSKGALPIRWMAPESLQYSCYNHKTDVWSFGILMWEIVTLGSMPYASMGARLVMRKVKEGYRLEKPKYCKMQFFNVICKCWHADPNKRPTFTELKQELYELLENPENLGNYVDLEGLAEDMNQVVHGSHNEKFII